MATIGEINFTDSEGEEYTLDIDINSIVIVNIPEAHEFSLRMRDDQDNIETTEFIGISPKR